MAFVMNIRTGKYASVPEHYLGHPVLGKDLVLADGEEVQAAPKKEKKEKKALVENAEVATEEQPAPESNIEENEDIEDAY